jgi:hypothetical protein
MSNGDVLLILMFAGCMGFLGGVLGSAAVWMYGRRWYPQLVQDQELPIRVRLAPIALQVSVPPPAPLVVPVEVQAAPAPSVAERGTLILGEMPDLGPSALARMLNCSKSTAAAIIGDCHSATRLEAGK